MRDDRFYLSQIREAIKEIRRDAAEGPASFFHNKMTQNAVIGNLMTIGEAAHNLSRELKRRWDDVPWSRIARFSEVRMEDYLGVDLKIVWDTLQNRLTDLLRRVEEILAEHRTP